MWSPLDPRLTVVDLHGRTLAWGERASSGDTTLVFVAPATGEYDLVLRDVRYRGGALFFYHLRAGAHPVVTSVYPLAGRSGTRVQLACSGSDGSRVSETLELDLAKRKPGFDVVRTITASGTERNRIRNIAAMPSMTAPRLAICEVNRLRSMLL